MTDASKEGWPAKNVSSIRETLNRIGAIRDDRIELFSSRTRDNPHLKVFRDTTSRGIFIDNHYVGDSEYASGDYRNQPMPLTKQAGRDYEDISDSERRYNSYRQFLTAKDICDFGCGAGGFLKRAQSIANSLYGVEIQKNYANELNNLGIKCYESIQNVTQPLDVVTLFHCLEHLPNPTSILQNLRTSLKSDGDGTLIVEVPHARDFN